ncbi:flagellar basal body rod protein FlgB [Vagococcus sp.]|uniref:flagellar basal body rod protein FlgB n=1 Tax=Vagococcus sp. TaxID=1933889 RepID=UPI003F968835
MSINTDFLHVGLNAASLRQKTISNNIANINTPNYKVERVEFEDSLKKMMNSSEGVSLVRTHEKHLLADGENSLEPRVLKRTNTMAREDGNNVDIEMEMAEKATNELYYNSLIRQLNGQFSMLNQVINH